MVRAIVYSLTLFLIGTIKTNLNSNDGKNHHSQRNQVNSIHHQPNYYDRVISYIPSVDGEPDHILSTNDSHLLSSSTSTSTSSTTRRPNSPLTNPSPTQCVIPGTPCTSGRRCTSTGVALCDRGFWTNLPCHPSLKCGTHKGDYFCDWKSSEHVVKC